VPLAQGLVGQARLPGRVPVAISFGTDRVSVYSAITLRGYFLTVASDSLLRYRLKRSQKKKRKNPSGSVTHSRLEGFLIAQLAITDFGSRAWVGCVDFGAPRLRAEAPNSADIPFAK